MCLTPTSKCVDIPEGWANKLESLYLPSNEACYVLYSLPNCEGSDFLVTYTKVMQRKTENLYDNNLAHRHASLRVCNKFESTHHS
ncbi:unnamed protein product, partial [Mesorhabditis spiculigera]